MDGFGEDKKYTQQIHVKEEKMREESERTIRNVTQKKKQIYVSEMRWKK